ncbi:MAG: transporter [Candidatus Latescibacterota bacterium]|nr:MAG: transporter [Candidatus Latescibacterota bacterium]
MLRRRLARSCLLVSLALPSVAAAHHGVASLGVAGLEGPGAPIETSSSATLPQGKFLGYLKLDYARFEKYTPERDAEGDYSAFWMYGVGYGARPWLSLYLFSPFYTKKAEDNSYNTSGFADLSATGVFGFKYDEGLRLVPPKESLDDMEDWHFTIYGGLSLPTGDANIKDGGGTIDPGMSLGFGRPSFSGGLTATKQLASRWTWVFDASLIRFSEYEYDDGVKIRFGDERRLNTALALRFLTAESRKLRLDGNLEANFLSLGRDEAGGAGEPATGGSMIYAVPGFRLYLENTSVGIGVKVPAWTDLNESDDQQGAEGKEDYRALFSFSVIL